MRLSLAAALVASGTLMMGVGTASAASKFTCKTERRPVDGDDGGVSGSIHFYKKGQSGIVWAVHFNALGERLFSGSALEEDEHAAIFASWNGRPEAALWPGETEENHDWWEDQYVNFSAVKGFGDGEAVCRLKKLVT